MRVRISNIYGTHDTLRGLLPACQQCSIENCGSSLRSVHMNSSCPVVGVSAAGWDTAHWKEVKLKAGQEGEPSCEHEALLTQQLRSFLPTEVWLLRFGLR
ncbi:hypothetical protein JOQ06_011124 [Pogonophryne albipinna]|uniref:Uncharacterized protein n=1 Tax=Pogonophryne albipinna TaxID=1090488 RepID=A0AAD6FGE1_9TELE|nr:hypothetical protein JOQ06_011124 [Pogonophryne albipinna]